MDGYLGFFASVIAFVSPEYLIKNVAADFVLEACLYMDVLILIQ